MLILAAIASLSILANKAPKAISFTVTKIEESLRPIALAPAPLGPNFAACMEDGSVRIIDSHTRQTVRVLKKHPEPAYGVAWSNDGNLVATGDETARIFVENALTGKTEHQYRTHTRGIEKLSFNATHQYLVSTGKDDFIKVYDVSTKKQKESVSISGKGRIFYGATFNTKDTFTIAAGDQAAGGEIIDARTGKVSRQITAHSNMGVFDIAFNPHGTRYVTAGRDSLAIMWDAKTGKKIGTLTGHAAWVMNVAFSPNGKFIATSSTDGTVKIWNAFNLQKIGELHNQMNVGSPICFTADGATLITVNDGGNLEFNAISPVQTPEIE